MKENTILTKVETITKDGLLQKLENNEQPQIVNVLSPEFYHLGFINGSRKIPLEELDKRHSELDPNREVITYCAHEECSASSQAAEKLSQRGFSVKAYQGGIQEWKQAGLPTE